MMVERELTPTILEQFLCGPAAVVLQEDTAASKIKTASSRTLIAVKITA
jgi:hypothetical protein